ncbi:MAG: hypothetical protein AAFX01_04070 [Cyanobacteria bacterium J06638_28]
MSWFDERGDRYLAAIEQMQQVQNQVEQERQMRLQAIPQLHQMGLAAEQIAQALGFSVDVVNAHLSTEQ